MGYALNNLIQTNYSREDLLKLRRPNKKGKSVAMVWNGSNGGLVADWYNLLLCLQPNCIITHTEDTADWQKIVTDPCFKGMVGNTLHNGYLDTGHAISIVSDQGNVFILDSMRNKPILWNRNTNHSKLFDQITVYVVVYYVNQ